MNNLIPTFILEKHPEGKYHGNFKAATMFVDISSFTPMTQELMKNGKEGAEILNDILTAVFTPVIEAVYNHGGFISSFEGDAFTAIFHRPEVLNRNEDMLSETQPSEYVSVCHTALTIIRIFKEIGCQKTKFGEFVLSVKIGLSYGNVEWGIVGEAHKTWFFRGKGLEGSIKAEKKCHSMEVLIHHQLLKLVKDDVETITFNRDFSHLNRVQEYSVQGNTLDSQFGSNDKLSNFLPNSILNSKSKGEFRDVACVFISFEEPSSLDDLNIFVGNIHDRAHELGGYFEGLNFSDKGGNCLIIFGAPLSHEDNIERAVDFVNAVRKDYGKNLRAGVTFGTVFTGIKGSQRRAIYGVIGDVVNLSARFMMSAEWGEVFVGDNIYRETKKQCEYVRLRPRKIKGFTNKIAPFKLLGKEKIRKVSFFKGEIVGRERELKRLVELLQPIKKGRFGGIVYVYGNPGIGKSRLIYELAQSQNIKTIILQTDSRLKKGLNPFVYLLIDFFEQSEARSIEERKAVFEKIYNRLVSRVSEDQINELRRIESIIGSLIGLSWEGSINEMIDEKSRQTVIQYAIKEFITTLSRIEPLILLVEDIQWIDEESQEVFQILTRQIGDVPLFILASSRYNDDGSKPVLRIDDNVQSTEINLDKLRAESILTLIENNLGLRPSNELCNYIQTRTEGNPFYAEQFCLYLRENDLIYKKGEFFQLTKELVNVPVGINMIMMARIDRLSSELKDTIQIASVLGREFEILVLKELIDILCRMDSDSTGVLRNVDIFPIVSKGETENIWSRLTELRYIFSHTLLRDAAYEMQLKTRLRSLHKLAGDTIVMLYPDEKMFFADVAYHYEKAEDWERALEYCTKAAYYYYESVRFEDSAIYYKKALSLTEKIYHPEHSYIADVMSKLAQVYGIQSLNSEAESLFLKALEIREKNYGSQHPEIATSLNNLADLYIEQILLDKAQPLAESALEMRENLFGSQHSDVADSLNTLATLRKAQGQYDQAVSLLKRAIQIREKNLGADHPDFAECLNNLAAVYYEQGLYDEAEQLYNRALNICEKKLGSHHPIFAVCLLNLAALHLGQSKYDSAEALSLRALEIREKVFGQQHPLIALNMTITANVYQISGRHDEAERLYESALEILKLVFDSKHPMVSNILYNLAALYRERGQFDKAEPILKNVLEIFENVHGHFHPSVAYALGKLASVYHIQGLYDKAEPLYERTIEIYEKIHGPEHLDLATCLCNLASVYSAQGRFEKAEQSFERGRKILVPILGPQHPEVASVLVNLARCYGTQKKYDKAEPILESALEIFKDKLGSESFESAICLANLGLFKLAQSHFDEAEPLFKKALEINEKNFGPDNMYVAMNLDGLARVYKEQGFHEIAEPLFLRCFTILEKEAPNHPDFPRNLDAFAELLEETGRTDEAKIQRERAQAMREKNVKK